MRLITELSTAPNEIKSPGHAGEGSHNRHKFSYFIGKSPPVQECIRQVHIVKDIHCPVLISGPSGTGKELIARNIHYSGLRRKKIFWPQNCGALPDTLLESLLFGHVKGGFTGAGANKEGLFQVTDGGTIFLDEIGEAYSPIRQ
jgi:transcriptional regulator with GAF, ATPase, and Fis domain